MVLFMKSERNEKNVILEIDTLVQLLLANSANRFAFTGWLHHNGVG